MSENTMTLAQVLRVLQEGKLITHEMRQFLIAHLSRSVSVSDEDVARVRDAVSHALSNALDCTRVWEAWSYGTMSEHDFIEVRDQPDRVDEIARAALEADRAGRGVVPDAIELDVSRHKAGEYDCGRVDGWNACREAMLAKTQPGEEGGV